MKGQKVLKKVKRGNDWYRFLARNNQNNFMFNPLSIKQGNY